MHSITKPTQEPEKLGFWKSLALKIADIVANTTQKGPK